jgi:hypothetical protein
LKKAFGPSKIYTGGGVGATGSVNPDAPWEQLEFVQIGHGSAWLKSSSPVLAQLPRFESSTSKATNGILLSTPAVTPTTEAPSFDFRTTPRPSFAAPSSMASTDSPAGTGEDEALVTPDLEASTDPKIHIHQPLSPVLSAYSAEGKVHGLPYSRDDAEQQIDRRPDGQTMKEFFDTAREGQENVERGRHSLSAGNGLQPLSATAYFNRQASLLMLYFPLAVSLLCSSSEGWIVANGLSSI